MNAESDAGSESGAETDSTDVNGVNVPDARKGGGKMKEKLMRKERHLGKIKKQMHEKDQEKPSVMALLKKEKDQIQKEIDHAVLKQRTSEPHGVANKR